MKILYIIILLVLTVSELVKADIEEHTFLKTKTQVKDPYSLRDPFRKLRIPTKKARLKAKEQLRGVFDNSAESVENKHSDAIKIIGVMLGRERRALAKASGGKETFILKEGMKIGQNNAEVKAILPGGVVLVEKIKNIYDQDEYLETIIPITGN